MHAPRRLVPSPSLPPVSPAPSLPPATNAQVAVASAGPPYRGNAYSTLSTSAFTDLSDGAAYDIDVVPRIASVLPARGSLAGGADLTLYGTGFGSHVGNLSVVVDGALCVTSLISEYALYCRVQPLGSWAARLPGSIDSRTDPKPSALPTPPPGHTAGALEWASSLQSHPSERGARYAWQRADGGGHEAILTPQFGIDPGHMALRRTADDATAIVAEAWFEAPRDGEVSFLLRLDAAATLEWSGNETATVRETLATSDGSGASEWAGWIGTGVPAVGAAYPVSRKLTLSSGRRYWLRLSCKARAQDTGAYDGRRLHETLPHGDNSYSATPGADVGVHPCSVAVRVHSHLMPSAATFVARKLTPIQFTGHENRLCKDITDKAECCNSYQYDKANTARIRGDKFTSFKSFCIPATTKFAMNGAACMHSEWVAKFALAEGETGACPARADTTLVDSPIAPRITLGAQWGCMDVTDRIACGRYVDGRTESVHIRQPCVAAQTQFYDGSICHTARYAQDIDPQQAATLQPYGTPRMSYRFGTEVVEHEVQRLSMRQHAPQRLSQLVTFTSVECPTGHDCMRPRGGQVYLLHGKCDGSYHGRCSSAAIDLKLASSNPSLIEQAFQPLQDQTYSRLKASIVSVDKRTMVWRLELATPWGACTDQHNLPLLEFHREAKVNVSVVVEKW